MGNAVVAGFEMTSNAPKLPKCRRRACRAEFKPMGASQVYCSYECASAEVPRIVRKVRLERTAPARKAKKEYRARTMSIGKLIALAQREFNRYIRLRDLGKPCISSGRKLVPSEVLRGHSADAGHYRSVGAAPHLRFNEDNCHLQSVADNRSLSGNAVAYRKGLIERIGLARVEALENSNEPHKWTREELVEIRRKYLRMWKELKAKRES